MDSHAKRAFAVLKPLKVTLLNFPATEVKHVEAADFPRDKSLGVHSLALTHTVYIEEEDFREVDAPDYYGLAPGKIAGLRYAGYVKVVEVVKDAGGKVVELRCEYDHERKSTAAKVKGNLHWVSPSTPGGEPGVAEVRLYSHMFQTEDPGETGDWEAEIVDGSEVVYPRCYIDESVANAVLPERCHFQFERLGYFVLDSDSDVSTRKYVFNQTVSLKEDATLKKVRAK